MTKQTENINKTGTITKKIISLFIPICLLLISLSLVNCPDPDTDTSTPGNGNGNGNGGGQPVVPGEIIVEYREGVTNKDALQNEFLLSLNSEPTGDVTVSITVRRSDDGGTATVKLKDSTDTATEMLTVTFTNQNWNIPQEFLLEYGNPSPDPANIKIVFKTTSTADTAYNGLTYIVSGNLTAELPNYSIHVHNARSPEPEDTDAEYTAEGTCTTASGTWDGTACTVNDNRDIKIWFTVDPSVSAATTEVICASAGGTWDSRSTTCTVTAENACNRAGGTWDSGNSTCTVTVDTACARAGGTWDSVTSTCTDTIANACTTAGGTWGSGTANCTITARNACNTAGGTWASGTSTCTVTVENDCTTAGGTWASGTSTCTITAEDVCTTAIGTWDSGNSTCTDTTEVACNTTGGSWEACTITAENTCTTAGGTWASGNCTITAANVCNTAGGFLDSSAYCTSDQKEIMINYEVKAGSAEAGTDYIAPTSNTAIIKAGNSGVSISIPLVEDSITNKDDEVDESFSVSITSVSTIGADVSIGDADATVTIGDPNESAFYFLPNRPLVNGDTPYWECYHLPESGETFIDIAALVGFFDGTFSSGLASVNAINNNLLVGVDTEPYKAFVNNSTFLLGFISHDRVAIKFGFDTGGNFSYDSSRDTLRYACGGAASGGVPAKSKTEGGAFGQLKFGQSYDRSE